MQHTTNYWRWLARRLAYLVAAAIICGGLLSVVLSHSAAVTDASGRPAWARPSAMAIQRVSLVTGAQQESTLLNNVDCTVLSFRVPGSDSMQSGCFTATVFGLMDADTGNVIFNGTDESLPLLPFAAHQVLAPWPGTMELISLDPVSTGGAYISLYRNPLLVLRDQRNLLGQLQAKNLIALPDLPLKNPASQRLVINSQTLAFSSTGAWMVVETLGGSFVRINLATLDMTAFAPAFGSQGSPALLKSRVTISDDGRFAAIMNAASNSFKVYDLTACGAATGNLQPRDCQSYDYYPFARQQISGLQSVRHLRFINDGLLSFEAITSTPTTTGTYELAPAASITALTDYIGLGDSFTSGEGAFDYTSGTDSGDNTCHLSRRSYPLLLTGHLFSAAGGHSVACSGATISDVGSTSDTYRGQVRGVASLRDLQQTQPQLLESVETNFVPGYIAQHRFVKRWQPRIITVSVGGDDVGFGDLLQTCVEPHVSRHLSDHTCFNTYEDRLELEKLIDRTVPRWISLYRQLQRESPTARLYAVGYPQLFNDKGNCALNVGLNKSELEFAAALVDYLNQDIHTAADTAGVPYIDIGQALAGHRLCETASYNVAVNGLTAGLDAGALGIKLFGKESYHPNILGQALMEQAILAQTRNLSGTAPGTATGVSGQALLAAPKTGRPISTRIPGAHLTAAVANRGTQLAVQTSGVDAGLKPKTTYRLHLDGPSGPVLGIITSGESGDISASVLLPDTTVPGGHTIDLTGENQAGQPVDAVQLIFVPSSEADSDGDTIPDILDTCPGAINSGQDLDRDGTDDICDSLIGLPPAPGASAGTGTSSSGASQGSASSTPAANSGSSGLGSSGVSTGSLQPAAQMSLTTFAIRPTPFNSSISAISAPGATPTATRVVHPAIAAGSPGNTRVHDSPASLPIIRSSPLPAFQSTLWRLWTCLLAVCWLLLLLIAGFYLRQAGRQVRAV